MLPVDAVNHIGIRVRDKDRSVAFYAALGFAWTSDAGFEQGHPIIMRHPSGVVLNLLGPATSDDEDNVLMDRESKAPGVTHFALTVSDLDQTKSVLAELGIPITGSFQFGGMSAVFIRDPDRTVIELDAYDKGDERGDDYASHP